MDVWLCSIILSYWTAILMLELKGGAGGNLDRQFWSWSLTLHVVLCGLCIL